jgi:hypothetical protein
MLQMLNITGVRKTQGSGLLVCGTELLCGWWLRFQGNVVKSSVFTLDGQAVQEEQPVWEKVWGQTNKVVMGGGL